MPFEQNPFLPSHLYEHLLLLEGKEGKRQNTQNQEWDGWKFNGGITELNHLCSPEVPLQMNSEQMKSSSGTESLRLIRGLEAWSM
jgi:hypothetical protein